MVWILVGLAFVASCKDSTSVKLASSLDDAQARWQAMAIHDYQFTFQVSCFCAITRPVTVTVTGDVPVTAVFADSLGGAADTAQYRPYLTIDRIFATLRASLGRNPASFTAQYDASLGYPRQASVDPVASTADDEYGIAVTTLNNPTGN
jgi:hypothetical protein